MKRSLAGSLGATLAFIFVALLLVLPATAFYSEKMHLSQMLSGPSAQFILGTDSLGRDLLTRLSMALYQSVLPLWAYVLAASLFGLGMGWIMLVSLSEPMRALRRLLLSFSVVYNGIPLAVVVLIAAVLFEKSSSQHLFLALAVAVFLRVLSELALLYERDQKLGYWSAHLGLGGSLPLRVWDYGIRGAWRSQLALLTLYHMKIALVIEASVSYLGFGITEPSSSFGNMLAAHLPLSLKGHFLQVFIILLAYLAVLHLPELLGRLLNAAGDRHHEQQPAKDEGATADRGYGSKPAWGGKRQPI